MLQQTRLPAGRGVPEACGAVPRRRRHLLAIGTKGDVVDEALVPAQDVSFNLADFPDTHRAIGGAGHQSGTVGCEDGRTLIGKDMAVSAEHTDQFARLGIPEAKCRIVRGGDHAPPIRAEDDMSHHARMPA